MIPACRSQSYDIVTRITAITSHTCNSINKIQYHHIFIYQVNINSYFCYHWITVLLHFQQLNFQILKRALKSLNFQFLKISPLPIVKFSNFKENFKTVKFSNFKRFWHSRQLTFQILKRALKLTLLNFQILKRALKFKNLTIESGKILQL